MISSAVRSVEIALAAEAKCQKEYLVAPIPQHAAAGCSRTLVMRWKMFVTWKLRAQTGQRDGDLVRAALPVMSSAMQQDACQRSRACSPVMRLKSVDLPAPLGPMMAWIRPVSIPSSTPRMISVAAEILAQVASARWQVRSWRGRSPSRTRRQPW